MRIRSPTTWIFLLVWGILAAFTGRALVREEASRPEPVAAPVATLTLRHGDVDYRPPELLVWSRAAAHQFFGTGDRIATGHGGRAKLQLGDGRLLELGEDSLVTLERQPRPEGGRAKGAGTLVLTLVTGTVRVKAAAPPPRQAVKGSAPALPPAPLVVRSGGEDVTLAEPAATVALEKHEDEPPRVVAKSGAVAVAPTPAQAPSPALGAASASAGLADASPPAATEPASAGLAAAPPSPAASASDGAAPTGQGDAQPRPPPLAAQDFAPSVAIAGRAAKGGQELKLWTEAELSAAAPLEVRVYPPAKALPPDVTWTPLVAVAGRAAPWRGRPVAPGVEPAPQSLAIAAGAAAGREELLVSPGARLARDPDEVEVSYEKRPIKLELASLRSLPAGGVRFYLNASEDPGAAAAGWVAEDPGLAPAAPLELALARTSDARRVWPFLAAAGRLGLRPKAGLHRGPTVCFVRDRQVVATLALSGIGNGLRESIAERLLALLDADLAYLGPVLAALPDLGRLGALRSPLLVLNRVFGDRTYGVSVPFLQQSAAAAAFVDETAAALLRGQIVILATRPDSRAAARPLTH